MRRGDVVRTVAELEALPVGTEVVDMDARRFKTSAEGAYPCDALGIASIQYPALVRVVGPVEPEWLEAAAQAAYALVSPKNLYRTDWGYLSPQAKEAELEKAKAAVAAADKARGIVNSREDYNRWLDANQANDLPNCHWAAIDADGRVTTGTSEYGTFAPTTFPAVVRLAR